MTSTPSVQNETAEPEVEPDKHDPPPEDEAPEKLSEILDLLIEKTDGDRVSVDDLLQAFAHRAYGPLMLVPALLAISPAGFIPGMSMVTGPIIFLIAAQMTFKRSGPWLPKKLRSFSLQREKLVKAMKTMKPWAEWIDPLVKERLAFMAQSPLNYLLAITCMALAVTMFPLAFVPFGVLAPGGAVTFFALGLTSRDGVIILLGYALTIVAGWLVIQAFLPLLS